MTELSARRLIPFALLVIAMGVTRFGSIGEHLHLQDASWAVFFLAGFYLQREWKWALPILLVEAIAIDWIAVGALGVSNYCLTVAYWFIVPSYASLWLGGAWLRQHYGLNLKSIAYFFLSLVVAINVCYLISNGSFYWLGGRGAALTFDGWLKNFSDWYLPFMRVPFIYVTAVAFVHVIAVQSAAYFTRRSRPRS